MEPQKEPKMSPKLDPKMVGTTSSEKTPILRSRGEIENDRGGSGRIGPSDGGSREGIREGVKPSFWIGKTNEAL